MRKALLFVALALLAGLWLCTFDAIYGVHVLPSRIPTHFDASGNVNGWGEPRMLWLLPILGALVSGLMTLVSFFPQAFNFPTRVTPVTRPRLESITLDMIAWLRAETTGIFLLIQYMTIQAVRTGLSRLFQPLVLLSILAIFATIGWHMIALIRAGRVAAGPVSPGLDSW